ncbi:MAG: hypothetical protein H0U75_12975 [Legionella sp.]|nr:hypothetical protein [Legionella sp.]
MKNHLTGVILFKEKQILLTYNNFAYSLIDFGVEVKKIVELSTNDLEDVFKWIKSDRDKLISIACRDSNAQILEEINRYIDTKLAPCIRSYGQSNQ